MIGQEFKSELRTYKDPKSGAEVTQLTNSGTINHHFYFTDNSFVTGDKEIFYLSDRASDVPRKKNMFRMDLETGISTQLTDEKIGIVGHTKTHDGEFAAYVTGNKVKLLNTKTGSITILYEEKNPNIRMAAPFISPDKKYLVFPRSLFPADSPRSGAHANATLVHTVKNSWLTVAYLDGSKVFDIFADTHYITHFQFSPNDSTLGLFSHEGSWDKVYQRMWLFDMVKREAYPCFQQNEGDAVGHEFWSRDGSGVYFDNRTKAYAADHDFSKRIVDTTKDIYPFVGFADKYGNLVKKIPMPYSCQHFNATKDNRYLVGDAIEDLILITADSENPKARTICTHGTEWDIFDGKSHPHPTFSWNNDKIIYSVKKNGVINMFIVKVDF